MRIFCLVLFIVAPIAMSAQQIITASSEPLHLYQQINNSINESQPEVALEKFEEVVRFFESEGREEELAQNFFGMALILALNGHYKESIQYHKKAIRWHKKFRDDEPWEIVMNLGLTYRLAGKDRKARKILGPNGFTS